MHSTNVIKAAYRISHASVTGGNARNPSVTCARVQSHFDCLNVGVTMCAQAGSR